MRVSHCPQCGDADIVGHLGGELFYCHQCTTTFAIVNVTARGWPARPLGQYDTVGTRTQELWSGEMVPDEERLGGAL